jgi:Short C-terminal domain/Bacterial PH domain
MNITDELRKLADLRAEGSLTDEEFAAAKRRLLAADGPEAKPPASVLEAEPVTANRDAIPEKTYRSSRWSSGNLFFPDVLVLAGDGLLFRKRSLFGSREEHINYKAVASLRVKNGVFLANLSIETTGGSQPIFINGLWKSDAREVQDVIRACQRTA